MKRKRFGSPDILKHSHSQNTKAPQNALKGIMRGVLRNRHKLLISDIETITQSTLNIRAAPLQGNKSLVAYRMKKCQYPVRIHFQNRR